jgi:DNA-binding Xre family transcriptional regulator
MAKRWSLNEDIIVCKYCIENLWAYSSDVDIEGIADKLEVAGFASRSKSAIRQRAYAYELLLERRRLSCIPEQVIMVYETVASENNHRLKEVKSYIREMYNPDALAEILDEKDDLSEVFGESNDLLDYKHTIEFNQTFPMVLQKYVELKKIKKHKAMCERIGMKPDTFSAILRGKYGDVKKDNVLRICVGLELSVSEAEELLNSAGFMLSNAVMTDVVIKACLWDRQYNVVVINSELYENDAPMLFKDYKISYDVM